MPSLDALAVNPPTDGRPDVLRSVAVEPGCSEGSIPPTARRGDVARSAPRRSTGDADTGAGAVGARVAGAATESTTV